MSSIYKAAISSLKFLFLSSTGATANKNPDLSDTRHSREFNYANKFSNIDHSVNNTTYITLRLVYES